MAEMTKAQSRYGASSSQPSNTFLDRKPADYNDANRADSTAYDDAYMDKYRSRLSKNLAGMSANDMYDDKGNTTPGHKAAVILAKHQAEADMRDWAAPKSDKGAK